MTALDGAPGSMGKGRIRTETDVANHAWAAPCGRLPAGLMIEAGQADLMLISWLGVAALNRGERVYRLLGCELTYHGDLPRLGDTLRFDIHLDGHTPGSLPRSPRRHGANSFSGLAQRPAERATSGNELRAHRAERDADQQK